MIYHAIWVSHFPHSARLQNAQSLALQSLFAAKTANATIVTIGCDTYSHPSLPKINIPLDQTSLQWGDSFPLPIHHVLLDSLANLASDDDWLLLANTDLVYAPYFYEIVNAFDLNKVYGFRRLDVEAKHTTIDQILTAPTQILPYGVDLIAITKKRYLADREILWSNTMVLGEPEWDPIVAGFYKKKNLWQNIDYGVYHPIHTYRWDLNNLSKSGLVNYQLRQRFIAEGLLEPQYVVEHPPLSRPFGFVLTEENWQNELVSIQNFLYHCRAVAIVEIINRTSKDLESVLQKISKIKLVTSFSSPTIELPCLSDWYPHTALEIAHTNKIPSIKTSSPLKIYSLPQHISNPNGTEFTLQIPREKHRALVYTSIPPLPESSSDALDIPAATTITLPVAQYFGHIALIAIHDKQLVLTYSSIESLSLKIVFNSDQQLTTKITLSPQSTTHTIPLGKLYSKPLTNVRSISITPSALITLKTLVLETCK